MLDSWGDNFPVPFCFFWQKTLSKLKVCSQGFWSSFPGLSSNLGDYYYQQEWWQNYENTTQFVTILSVCLTRWLLVEQPTKRYKHSLFTGSVAQVHHPTLLPECLLHHLKMFNFFGKKILQIFEFPGSSCVAVLYEDSTQSYSETGKNYTQTAFWSVRCFQLWVLSLLFLPHQVLNGNSRMLRERGRETGSHTED